jgi:hypothetical protein
VYNVFIIKGGNFMPGRLGPAGRGGTRRRTRRRTAAVVGGASYVAGKKKGSKSDDQPAEVPAAQPATQSDPMAELQKLGDLHKQGIVTDAEFEAKKADLLSKI